MKKKICIYSVKKLLIFYQTNKQSLQDMGLFSSDEIFIFSIKKFMKKRFHQND